MAYVYFVFPIHGHEHLYYIYSHGSVVYFRLAAMFTESICIVLLLIILIEILSSRPIICCKCLYYFPWVNLVYMLMNYVSLYANISYIFHMLLYLGCLGQFVGIKHWIVSSTMVFYESLDEVGF
jgi:hypothetical protein